MKGSGDLAAARRVISYKYMEQAAKVVNYGEIYF